MDQNILEDHIPMRRIQDDTVLARAAQQNPAQFEALYRKWLKPVYRYFYFRVGSVKDAEDLSAQVFLKAYQDLPRYHNRGAFSAWLFTIAHARLVDHYRRDGRKAAREVLHRTVGDPGQRGGPAGAGCPVKTRSSRYSLY